MPDDDKPTAGEGKPAEKPKPDPAMAEFQRKLNEQAEQIRAQQETIQALMGGNPPADPGARGGGGPSSGPAVSVPPAIYHLLRKEGLSDKEIQETAPLIMPWIKIAAGEMVGLVGGVKDEMDTRHAASDSARFPHWNLEIEGPNGEKTRIADRITQLRAEARKRGEHLTPDVAYALAISQHLPAVMKATAETQGEGGAAEGGSSPVSQRSADASAGQSRPVGRARDASQRQTVMTPEEVERLPKTEQDAFWQGMAGARIA